MTKQSQQVFHESIVDRIADGIDGNIRSVSIIGSYLIDGALRPGSDIDLIIAVNNLDDAKINFDDIVYKDVVIEDSMGQRKEQNVIHDGNILDLTVIDSFNKPNNPLTDNYENAIGSCRGSLPIFGDSLSSLFEIDRLISDYETIREPRLAIVEDKIDSTKEKIEQQGRSDLHIVYELQRYVFIQECIRRRIFNQFSLKHPELSIPEFNSVFDRVLKSCGVVLKLDRKI